MSSKSTASSTSHHTRTSTERQSNSPATEGELLPAPVDDTVITEVVQALNALQRDSTFAFARQAGQLVLDTFYGGDTSAWRDRGTKDSSFRKLAAKADEGALQMSASALYRCVALVELERRLGVSEWKHLTVSHVRAVFGLPENAQQRLLTQAEDKAWTVDKIEQAAAGVREERADGRGRPPLPAFVKTVNRLGKLLASEEDAFGGLESVEHLDGDEATRLYQAVTGMKLKCEELQRALAKKVPGVG